MPGASRANLFEPTGKIYDHKSITTFRLNFRTLALREILALISLAAAAGGQSFEVASIRPHVFTNGSGAGRSGISTSGNRVTASIVTLNRLIMEAYDVKEYQISGGPSWSAQRASSFDVSAVAAGDGTLTQERSRPMLQSLLADRFQLTLHRETKELPVYALVVAKNGPRLKQSAPDAKAGFDSSTGVAGFMTATGVTMTGLANRLSGEAGRPVVDRTDVTGNYDFKLQWLRDPNQPDAAPNSPSLFTAVQEQLGLKLESAKQATEVLVIDRAEKPSEN